MASSPVSATVIEEPDQRSSLGIESTLDKADSDPEGFTQDNGSAALPPESSSETLASADGTGSPSTEEITAEDPSHFQDDSNHESEPTEFTIADADNGSSESPPESLSPPEREANSLSQEVISAEEGLQSFQPSLEDLLQQITDVSPPLDDIDAISTGSGPQTGTDYEADFEAGDGDGEGEGPGDPEYYESEDD